MVNVLLLALSFFANFLNYFDRFLVSVVLPEIKETFDLNELQAGLLWTSFTVGFLLSAPLVGYLADKHSRTKIFGICVVIWSIATILCAYVTDFSHLIILRTLIGIGEAGCLSIAPAILSQKFKESMRGKILSVFYAGFPLGATCAYLFGGWINSVLGWESIFIFAGAPGILVGIGLTLFTDIRKRSEISKKNEKMALENYLTFLKNKPFVLIALSQALLTFAFIPVAHWGIDYFQTVKDFDKEEITYSFGISALLAGIIGNGLGGYIGDILNKKIVGGYLIMCSVALLVGFPFLWLAITTDSETLIIISIFMSFLSFHTFLPAINAQLAGIVDESKRSMAFAMTIFILHIFGDTVSPLVFGKLADSYGKRTIFQVIILLVPLSSAICFFGYLLMKKRYQR